MNRGSQRADHQGHCVAHHSHSLTLLITPPSWAGLSLISDLKPVDCLLFFLRLTEGSRISFFAFLPNVIHIVGLIQLTGTLDPASRSVSDRERQDMSTSHTFYFTMDLIIINHGPTDMMGRPAQARTAVWFLFPHFRQRLGSVGCVHTHR